MHDDRRFFGHDVSVKFQAACQRSRLGPTLAVFLCTLVAATIHRPMEAVANEPARIEDVEINLDHLASMEASWNKRFNVKTAKVTWTTDTYRNFRDIEGDQAPSVSLRTTDTLWIGPNRSRRYEQQGHHKKHEENTIITLHTTWTDNGNGVWKELMSKPQKTTPPVGWIRAAKWGEQSLLPVSLYFTRNERSRNAADFHVVNRNYPVNGRTCLYLESEIRTGTSVSRIAVDPEREFVITQFDFLSASNELLLQFRIDYHEHPELGWVPSSWTHTNWNFVGEIFDHRKAIVTEVELNREYPADTFDLQFPDGTSVTDEIRGTRAKYYAPSIVSEEKPTQQIPLAVTTKIAPAPGGITPLIVAVVAAVGIFGCYFMWKARYQANG